jgi:hypothetical protein
MGRGVLGGMVEEGEHKGWGGECWEGWWRRVSTRDGDGRFVCTYRVDLLSGIAFFRCTVLYHNVLQCMIRIAWV